MSEIAEPAVIGCNMNEMEPAVVVSCSGSESGSDSAVFRVPVCILGGTGLSGRAVYQMLCRHQIFDCQCIVGSPKSFGRPYADVWREKEERLVAAHGALGYEAMEFPRGSNPNPFVMSFADFVSKHSPSSIEYVVSTISPALASLEEELVGLGFRVVSISPCGREPANTFVLERRVPSRPLPLYKSPNCVVCGVAPVLAAIYERADSSWWSVDRVTVTTLQSLTGRGDSPYESSLCIGSTLPVGQVEETENYIANELCGLFGMSSGPAPMGGDKGASVDVRCYRGGAVRGHLVDLRVELSGGASYTSAQVSSWFSSFDPLKEFKASCREQGFYLTGSDELPIRYEGSKWGASQRDVLGMQVIVTNLYCSGNCIKCTVLVDNLVKGAAGAAVQIMEWVEWQDRQNWSSLKVPPP